jgi:hypothetical protein
MNKQEDLMSLDIPLRVLICDPDPVTKDALFEQLSKHTAVVFVDAVDIKVSEEQLRADEINTIFIDPLINFDATAGFIFAVRRSHPEIVFVLYMDVATAEAKRRIFYQGERRRFSHYYTLDKAVPVTSFSDEVDSVIRICQKDLGWRLSSATLKRLTEPRTSRAKQEPARAVQEVRELVARVSAARQSLPKKNTVFLSYRFSEIEYAEGLIPLLEERGFIVITGKRSNSYISRAIIDRIRDCEYFLCLMTRDKEKTDGTFTTGTWLLEEKGVALALGKQLVLMVEEGVDDFGGLQGDWQRIHFGPKGFLKAALEAAQQLASYSGRGEEEEEDREMTDAKKSSNGGKSLFREWLDLNLDMDNEDELLGNELVPILQNNPNAKVLLLACDGSSPKRDGMNEAERVSARLTEEFDIPSERIKIKHGGAGEGWGIDIQVFQR